MKDERMAQSEALYGFLTPTPEYFQQPVQEKRSSQFIKTILKRYRASQMKIIKIQNVIDI